MDFEREVVCPAMAWDVDQWRSVLKTDHVRGMPRPVLAKRIGMIDEAIGFGGTLDCPQRHMIYEVDGVALLFEKPGKEARAGTNVNDMRPTVIVNGKELPPPSFAHIWADLTNMAMADFEAFKAVLLLIYRSALLLDHKRVDDSGWRLSPEPQIVDCIDALEKEVGQRTEFGSVRGLLGFIDILGWNEDVKYHSFNRKASFTEGKYGGKAKEKIGRFNTLLSCIRVPYEVSEFMLAHRDEISGGQKADFVPLYDIMQALINSRGLCTPQRREELNRFLSPYLTDRSELIIGEDVGKGLSAGQGSLEQFDLH